MKECCLEDKIKTYTQRPPRSDTEGRKLNLNLYCQVITPDRAKKKNSHLLAKAMKEFCLEDKIIFTKARVENTRARRDKIEVL